MTIESNSAQVNVKDNDSRGGVNINQTLGGYAADMMFWGGPVYLCRRKDDAFLRMVMVPSEKWLQDIKDDGYKVIGEIRDLLGPRPKLDYALLMERDCSGDLYRASVALIKNPKDKNCWSNLANAAGRLDAAMQSRRIVELQPQHESELEEDRLAESQERMASIQELANK